MGLKLFKIGLTLEDIFNLVSSSKTEWNHYPQIFTLCWKVDYSDLADSFENETKLKIPPEIEPHLLKFNAFTFCHPLKKGRCPMSMLEQLSAGTIYIPFLSKWKKMKARLEF